MCDYLNVVSLETLAGRRQHAEEPRLEEYGGRFPDDRDLLLKSDVEFAREGAGVEIAPLEPTVTLRQPVRTFREFKIYEELGTGAGKCSYSSYGEAPTASNHTRLASNPFRGRQAAQHELSSG